MIIETKYNLGDRVMFYNEWENNRVVTGVICSIRIDRSSLDEKYNRDMYEIEVNKVYHSDMQFCWVKPKDVIRKVEDVDDEN